jgi:hypothetical protein
MFDATTRRSSSLLLAVMAAAVLGAIGPGRINAAAPVTAVAAAETPVNAVTVAVAAASRCGGCGFVQAIRHIEATASAPAAYEFTVRMRDGSVRTSSDANVGKWVVGDRIILVGGAGPTVR